MALESMVGLTPTFIVRVPTTVDLTEAQTVYVSFKQSVNLVMKKTSGFIVDAHSVSIYLTQAETLLFRPDVATMQVNWVYPTGQRGATRWIDIRFDKNHLPEVLE